MKQSKRLMVILTPTPEPEVADKSPALAQTDALTEFDWQVRSFKNRFCCYFVEPRSTRLQRVANRAQNRAKNPLAKIILTRFGVFICLANLLGWAPPRAGPERDEYNSDPDRGDGPRSIQAPPCWFPAPD